MAKEKETQEKPAKSKNKIFLICLPLLILLFAAGGAGFYFMGVFDSGGSAQAGQQRRDARENEKLGPLVKMEDFVVNIMHEDSSRFLKLGISMEVKDEEGSKAIKKRAPQIRDAVLMLLGNKRYSEIKDLQGKMQLKADLLARIQELSGQGEVTNLYFTDFVVQ
ncbi:MAG: flagellar basal body-associated FliL family protein [Desulfobacteraceae bacterium]|nr:flagellar basal body-associated FliL family protein [Desulfobacteraceae bacterium]